MNDLNAASIVLGAITLTATVGWMVWTARQARISRRGPTDDVRSYLRHDKATGAVAMCVAVTGVVITAVIVGQHPVPIWPGAIAGVLAIIACERRWPRPSGSIRSVPLVAPRGSRKLVPWLGVALAGIGLVAVTLVIGFCWMVGDTPDGRTIRGNVTWPGQGGLDGVVVVDGFPGSSVGLITAVGGVALLAAVAIGWLLVARRPALRAVRPDLDLQFRRASIDRMVRIVAVAALLTTSEFYESARSTYVELHIKMDPLAGTPAQPFGWLPVTCSFLILLAYLFNRPRPKLDSDLPAVKADQPA